MPQRARDALNPMDDANDTILRDWLLGKLPARDCELLEERLLHDDVLGLRLQAVETDLLDDVASGRIGASDRAAALRIIAATPKDRQRLRIAAALARVLANAASEHAGDGTQVVPHSGAPLRRRMRRWPAFAFGALAAACMAVAVVGLQRRGSDGLPAPETAAAATITLTADQPRGASVESIGIARGAATVRMQVEVDHAAAGSRFDLRIEDEGRVVFTADGLAPREAGVYRFVEALVPANVLASGGHTVRLRATGESSAGQGWSIRTHAE